MAQQGKPEFRLSRTEVYLEDAVGRKEQLVISVEGADKLYCDTLLYVYYDKHLKIGEIKKGAAIDELTAVNVMGETGDFVVLTTCGKADLGKDGVMWTIDVTLPDDCKAGDEYAFEIGKSKYGKLQPLFSNFAYDEKATAMTQYIFSSGLDKGGIKVLANLDYILGDVNNDKFVDAVDASTVLKEYALQSIGSASSFTDPRQSKAADVNSDGFVDSSDASVILAFYANLSGSDPIYDIKEFQKKR